MTNLAYPSLYRKLGVAISVSTPVVCIEHQNIPMAKRGAIESFLQPSKKVRHDVEGPDLSMRPTAPPSYHSTYPFPISQLSLNIIEALNYVPAAQERPINDKPNLDIVYFEPFIPKSIQLQLFNFVRSELFFYRVKYKIKRGGFETDINTPRYTSVFGVDEGAQFVERTGQAPEVSTNVPTSLHKSPKILVETSSRKPVAPTKYSCNPRPIPECLDTIRRATEAVTGESFNFCLVNYYSDGNDSISYHSDDEKFLGSNPAIASFSLGARRDFVMKPKPADEAKHPEDGSEGKASGKTQQPLKLPLGPGDMILMRGRTQANWLHSIPKRKGGMSDMGRINITFRKALVKGGTENYYQVCSSLRYGFVL